MQIPLTLCSRPSLQARSGQHLQSKATAEEQEPAARTATTSTHQPLGVSEMYSPQWKMGPRVAVLCFPGSPHRCHSSLPRRQVPEFSKRAEGPWGGSSAGHFNYQEGMWFGAGEDWARASHTLLCFWNVIPAVCTL